MDKTLLNYVICGCVRNCQKYLKDVFNNISLIQKELNIIKIIVAFDESEDDTLIELNKLKELFNLEILINKNKLTSHRTLNISNARNMLLDYLINNENKIDYFIMMDFDDICSKPINIDVLTESLSFEWDCITYNNENYYDFWALAIDDYEISCWHWNNPKIIINLMKKNLINKFNESDNNIIECISAFNGFGIYNFSKFNNIRYSPFINLNLYNLNKIKYIQNLTNLKVVNLKHKLDCEHKNFHLNSKKINNLYIFIYKKYLFPKYEGIHTSILDT